MTNRRSDSGIGEARGYHPRGRTVRERPGRGGDPFRSALQIFDPRPAGGTGGGRPPKQPVRPSPRQSARPAARQPAGTARQSAGTAGQPAGAARKAAGTARKAAGAGRPAAAAAPRHRPAARPHRPPRTAAPSRPARPPRLASPRRRLRLATVLALSLFAVLALRLVELQLTEGPAYAATGLQDRLQTVTLPAARGAIFDRNGAVLAHSVEARFVYADPELVVEPTEVASALQPLLGIPASELAKQMQPAAREDGSQSRFEWLARGVDIATGDAIEALNLPGIGVDRDERRIVPGNDLAANLIGFTGTDLAGLEGLEGLEAAYDDTLRGVDGERTYESGQGASLDRPIPGGYQVEQPPQPGSDLRLAVDMDLQYEVQRVLAERLRAANATFGAAVVLDARTGDVLAQASYPTYNAADPQSVPEQVRVDASTATVFDPGSAHKPLVFGAALEEGVIRPGQSITVGPSIRKGDVTFTDTTPQAEGTELSLPAVLAFSSNVGTIKIADLLGSEKLYAYQRAFGLGEATGVGMPGEATGGLLAPEDWYGSSAGSVPIGHSVDVTTLQMAAAYGAIANDGVWVQPQLVEAVLGPDGTEQPAADPATRRVLSPENAAYLRELMEAVVTAPGATGLAAALDDYRVAGKTGTGKLVVDGAYAPGEVASFVGLAPAEDPRYVIAVAAHTPGGGGGEVTAPAFREMMGFTLHHYQVPPASTEPPTFELYP
ncbi:MAG: penicillin-binding protein 2 [Micromonosporaceae bacterium]|nr:penicillin-binding protein 2 [Micromonosporaceae bacterium]